MSPDLSPVYRERTRRAVTLLLLVALALAAAAIQHVSGADASMADDRSGAAAAAASPLRTTFGYVPALARSLI